MISSSLFHSYSDTVKRFSSIYSDRPIGPLKSAKYWVEYVIRHKGAFHLRSLAAEQNFIQKNSLDILGLLAGVLYVVYRVIKLLVKGVRKVVCKLRSGRLVEGKKVN